MTTLDTEYAFPAPKTVRAEGRRNPLGLILEFGRGYPSQSVLVLLAFLISGLAEGIGFVSILPLFDALMGSTNGDLVGTGSSGPTQYLITLFLWLGVTPNVAAILFFIVVCIALKGGCQFIALRYAGNVLVEIATDLRLSVIQSMLKARWEYFIRQPIGKFANAIGVESTKGAGAYQQGSQLVAAAMQSAIFLSLSLYISWKISIGAIAAGCILWLLLHPFVILSRRSAERQRAVFQSISSRLVDVLQGIKPIKAMNCENFLGPTLKFDINELKSAQRQQVLAKHGLASLQEPIIVGILAVGFFFMFTYTDTNLPTLIVLTVLFQRATSGLGRMQKAYQALNISAAFFWAIRDRCADAESAAQDTQQGTLSLQLDSAIRFQKVSFSYDGQRVLDGVSFEIPAHAVTAIIGPSGSGKTTIVDLICGLFEPDKGGIYVDNIQLAQADLKQWRSQIGYVPQELFLFHESVFLNVTLRDPTITREQASTALRLAGGWEFVEALPDGLDTIIGERGIGLSGGQRQRIAIARALARQPKLLILDEATASLDPRTEASILETLRGLTSALTILAISHRPQISEIADHGLYISHGKVSSAFKTGTQG